MKIFKKMKHKNFTLGGFCPGFCLGGFCPGGFVLEPKKLASIILFNFAFMYQSIPGLTIPPPGDSHILVAPGVWFSLLCLAQGSARGSAPGGS